MGGSDSAEMLQGELGAPNGNGDPISPYTGAGPRGEDCECQAQWRGPEPAVGTKPSPSLGPAAGTWQSPWHREEEYKGERKRRRKVHSTHRGTHTAHRVIELLRLDAAHAAPCQHRPTWGHQAVTIFSLSPWLHAGSALLSPTSMWGR